jgi:branched-chain amino acid transport system substrate-binding protein
VDRGVECYERLKARNGGAISFSPVSTGIAYALIERSARDKIPLITMGLGRGDASDGTVFPYAFTIPTTYWSGASALINYIAQREGGMDKLKGKTSRMFISTSPMAANRSKPSRRWPRNTVST